MHAGKEIKLRRGAVWACAIPIGLGLALAIVTVNRMLNYNDVGAVILLNIFVAPLYYTAVLLFVPPLTAWLTGLRLRRIADPEKLKQWRVIFISALTIGTALQFLMALGLAHYLSIQAEKLAGIYGTDIKDAGVRVNQTLNAYKVVAIANSLVWIILTAPLCAVGVSIFRRKTKFPSDRTVF